jgi:hypothetical protein
MTRTNSSAIFSDLNEALDYANAFVADGFASSYEIAADTGPIYGDTRFTISFFLNA